MIFFKPLYSLSRGEIYKALTVIYSAYKEINIHLYADWLKNWDKYDKLVFDNPETVGESGFATFTDSTFAGFCSWDPRYWAEKIIIGHNGILPEFRGKGLGVKQVDEMLNRFKKSGYHSIHVITGDEDFFIPAQKMYTKCGFTEISRRIIDDQPSIEYKIEL